MIVVSGLAVIFGILRVINMAHGEFIMVGAYVSYYVEPYSHALGYILAPMVTGLMGLLVYWLVVKRVQKRLIDSILATWGVALVLKYGMTLIAGASSVTVAVPITGTLFNFPLYRIGIMVMTLTLLGGVYWLFFRARFGLRTRAVVHNAALSATSGIDNQRVRRQTFMIGCAMAGFAGTMLAPTLSISPLLGESYLIPSFLSVLLGGMDSLVAPLIGASAIAGSESALTRLIDPVSAQILTLLFVIVLLKWFPKGMVNTLINKWQTRK